MVRDIILGEDETIVEWMVTLAAGYLVGRFMWKLINGEKWITALANGVRQLVGLPKVDGE